MNYLIERKVRQILEERGIQQKFVCEKVGIPIANFNLSMNQKRKLKATELISICIYLGIDLNIFKGLEEDFNGISN